MRSNDFVRRCLCGCVLGVAFAWALTAAPAQTPPDQKGDQPVQEAAQARGRAAPLNLDQLFPAMEEKLELTAEQKEDIQHLIQEHRQKAQEAQASREAELNEQREMMRQLLQERMEAREAGDKEREKEILDKLRELRPGNVTQELEDELVKNISEVLDEQQREQFLVIVHRMRYPAEDPARLRTNPSLLRRAVMRLGLDESQRAEIEELFQGYWTQMRDDQPQDQQARDEMALRFYEQVMQVLTKEQKAELEKNPLGRENRPQRPRPVDPQQVPPPDERSDPED